MYARTSTAVGKTSGIATFLPDCATIVYADTKTSWIRTVDFGTDGCAMKNGNILKGKVTISGSVDFTQPSYTVTCSFDNFYHNGNLIQGGYSMVRTFGSTANLQTAHPVLTMNVDLKVIAPNGIARTITGTRVREMIVGFETPAQWLDDAFLISGDLFVTSPKGKITSTITAPLKVTMNCNHVIQGVIVYTKNAKTASLDYGDGTCDNEAMCTINGEVKKIILGK